MTDDALRAGKAVFVEKPLALNLAGLEQVRRAVVETGNDRLFVGFNRRFSPLVKEMRKLFQRTGVPLMMIYRVHAGQIEPGSWYLDPSEGSRFEGEAGHFFDVFSYISGSRPVSVMAKSLRPEKALQDDLENIAVIVDYEDGSVGNLLYLTQGGQKLPKEYLEIFGGGCTAQLHNFESLTIFEGNSWRRLKRARLQKGQKEEIDTFIRAVKSGSDMPISVDSLLDTTLATLAAVQSSKTGKPVQLEDFWEREF